MLALERIEGWLQKAWRAAGASRVPIPRSPKTAVRRRFTLRPGEAWRSPGRRRGAVLHVETGRVWLTVEGNPKDLFLAPGDRLLLLGGGLVVAEAMTATPAVFTWS